MNLSIGIVGLPNVGKSTMFNALTKKSVPASNYPFCTIDPSVGIVPVPDNRLKRLAEISGSQQIIPAVIEFTDIAGLVEGASKGEGLGNKFLHNIRETDAILHMVRIFDLTSKSGNTVNHVYGSVDPLRDIDVITMELVLADLNSVEKRIEKNLREVKRGDKKIVQEQELLLRVQEVLAMGKPASILDYTEDESLLLATLHLLTIKPVLFCFNKSSEFTNLDESNPVEFQKVINYVKEIGAEYVVVDAGMEDDLKDFADQEKNEMRLEMGSSNDGIDNMIQSAYRLLGLISYFTTGMQETRAWTVTRGVTAKEAGRAIHNDFAEKFIRAHVTAFDDLDQVGSLSECRNLGKLRTEGRDYIVKDGDVIEFLI